MKKMLFVLLALVIALASFSTVLADTGYIVQRGDTLYRIAARFGVSVPALAAANGLTNPNLIHVGQRLVIPGPGGAPAPTTAPWTGQYVVQRGDTLWRIAQRFGSTVDAIKATNNLRSNLIYPGQILNIPGRQQPPATPAAPKPTVTPPTPQVCSTNWFFTQRPVGCPASAPVESWSAAQRFERGLMLWVQNTDTFYVLHNPVGQAVPRLTVVQGPLKLLPGANLNNRVGGAPAGYQEPISGFGLLWRGEVENVTNLRSQLGWALQPEYGFQTTYQCEAYPSGLASLSCYRRNPEGGLLLTYYVTGDGYYWRTWP
jgi:LysM repeat protein